MRWFRRNMAKKSGDIQLSPSSISVAADCPRCFYLTHHGISRPRGIFPSMPGGVDRALKIWTDDKRANGGGLPSIFARQLPGRRLYTEKARRLACRFENLGASLAGIPDELLVEADGKLSILDFKTKSGPPGSDIHPAYQRQMDLYALLVERSGDYPATSRKAYLAFVYPVVINTGLGYGGKIVEVKLDPQRAFLKFRQAVDILKGPPPRPSIECEYCTREAMIIQYTRTRNSTVAIDDEFIRAAEKKNKKNENRNE